MFFMLANLFLNKLKTVTPPPPLPSLEDRADAMVFAVHPIQLSRWLDEAWESTRRAPVEELKAGGGESFLGDQRIIDRLALPAPFCGDSPLDPVLILPSGIELADTEVYTGDAGPTTVSGQTVVPCEPAVGLIGLLWHHLIYAYLVESTGIMEVFAEVVRRFVVGESLESPSLEAVEWVRATEELFFRDPPLFSIPGVVSELRPWARVNRRNAYWRMFSLDLPHPIPARWSPPSGAGGQLWKQDIGNGVNAEFREKWAELLRQVWLGIENSRNTSGGNPTDAGYVALLCKAIKDMLNMRRRDGMLAREEFVYVTVLSWFHLTVRFNSPIVKALRAEASSPADRLARVAARVGMTSAPQSRELFDLAEPMSAVLRAIELGLFDDPVRARALFEGDSVLRNDMNRIIDNWQSATGERVKDRPTGNVVSTLPAQPLRIPTPGPTTVAPLPAAGRVASNGRPMPGR